MLVRLTNLELKAATLEVFVHSLVVPFMIAHEYLPLNCLVRYHPARDWLLSNCHTVATLFPQMVDVWLSDWPDIRLLAR